MKHCKKCNRTLDETEFCKSKDKKDGLRTSCKSCTRSNSKNHYGRCKEKYKERIYGKRNQSKDYIRSIMMGNRCMDCGMEDPVVLEFDHLTDKKFNISEMATRGIDLERIKLEIEKCQIRCSNCHRRKTSIEQGWYSDIIDEVKAKLAGMLP